MARRLCLLMLNRLDRVRKCGAAANVASLVIAIVITGAVAQHVIERILPDLCALPVSVGHQIGVHGQFLSFVMEARFGGSHLQAWSLCLLAQEEADDVRSTPPATGWSIGDVPLGCAIP